MQVAQQTVAVHVRVYDNAATDHIIACMRSDPKLNGFNITQQAYVILVAPPKAVRDATDKDEVKREAMIHGIRVCFPGDDFLRVLLTTGKTHTDDIRRELKAANLLDIGQDIRVNVCAQPLRIIAEEEIRGKAATQRHNDLQVQPPALVLQATVTPIQAAVEAPKEQPGEKLATTSTVDVPMTDVSVESNSNLIVDIKEVWASEEPMVAIEVDLDQVIGASGEDRTADYTSEYGVGEDGRNVLVILRDFSTIGKRNQAIARLYYDRTTGSFNMDVSTSHRKRGFQLKLKARLYTHA